MRKLIVIALAVMSLQVFAQQSTILEKPTVDKRIELLSIVFRLAEAPEYSATIFKLYTDRIENHFAPYKNHELIDYCKSLRESFGISFDAVMSMAIHLDENLKLLNTVKDNSLEERWTKDAASKFSKLLRKFYKDANCEQFFTDNKDLYAEASNRFLPIYEHIDLQWYHTFFGREPQEKFIIINGLGNGPGNYGPGVLYKDGNEDLFAIMGAWDVDSVGMPVFLIEDYLPTLIHEFNHSFVNYLNAKYRDLFKESAPEIFAVVEDKMRSQAYGDWETMLNEALVRAAVIKYMKDHDYAKQEVDRATLYEIGRGFYWISDLISELDAYDQHRDQYQDLDSYIPHLAECYKVWAQKAQGL